MNQLLHGDCLEVMRGMAEASVDAIVTDPPYGLAFMGKSWDHGVPGVPFWSEALRVLKPGGHLLAFGGTRTFHRLTCVIEDAGFEIRDCIMWVYGSGFPKSHNGPWGGTALKPAWEPIIVARRPLEGTVAENVLKHGTGALNIDGCRIPVDSSVDDPRLGGNGTWSSEKMAKNVYEGGYAGNRVGSSPLGRWPANICHDGSDDVLACFPQSGGQAGAVRGTEPSAKARNCMGDFSGRHAAEPRGDTGSAARFFKSCEMEDEQWLDFNLSLAPIAGKCLDLQSVLDSIARSDAATWALPAGTALSVALAPSTSVTASESRILAESVITAMLTIGPRFLREWRQQRLSPSNSRVSVVATREQTGITTITASHWKSDGSADPVIFSITPLNSEHGEAGCASRLIYCAKASRQDRNEGLEGREKKPLNWSSGTQNPGSFQGAGTDKTSENNHPTVKPAELMRYLCRLVTPKGGIVLDPFAGSGSTGKAAVMEGFDFIGIELEAQYIEIAKARLAFAEDTAADIAQEERLRMAQGALF